MEEYKEELSKNIKLNIDFAKRHLAQTIYKQAILEGVATTIYSNHYLISKGKGIVAIPAELVEEFKELLISYYEGKEEEKIKKFIKEKCYISL